MRPLPDAPVFSRADARACGWTDAALSRAIRAGRLTRIRRGQLTACAAIGRRERCVAAVQACAGSVLSHRSALEVYGLPIIGPAPERPELTVQPRRIGRLVDAHLYRATLEPADVVVVDGTPVASLPRALIDNARNRSTSAAVAAIDAALHRELVTLDDLEQVLVRCWNWPGIRRAQRALALVDARSESALESVSRLVIGWLGLPTPQLQPVILDGRGYAVGRLDFYWDEYGVAGEADGRAKYDERPVLVAEKERQECLEDLAVVVTRWGWVHPVGRPHQLRTRIEAAFERGRLRDRSGFRRRWSVRPS